MCHGPNDYNACRTLCIIQFYKELFSKWSSKKVKVQRSNYFSVAEISFQKYFTSLLKAGLIRDLVVAIFSPVLTNISILFTNTSYSDHISV